MVEDESDFHVTMKWFYSLNKSKTTNTLYNSQCYWLVVGFDLLPNNYPALWPIEISFWYAVKFFNNLIGQSNNDYSIVAWYVSCVNLWWMKQTLTITILFSRSIGNHSYYESSKTSKKLRVILLLQSLRVIRSDVREVCANSTLFHFFYPQTLFGESCRYNATNQCIIGTGVTPLGMCYIIFKCLTLSIPTVSKGMVQQDSFRKYPYLLSHRRS